MKPSKQELAVKLDIAMTEYRAALKAYANAEGDAKEHASRMLIKAEQKMDRVSAEVERITALLDTESSWP